MISHNAVRCSFCGARTHTRADCLPYAVAARRDPKFPTMQDIRERQLKTWREVAKVNEGHSRARRSRPAVSKHDDSPDGNGG
jgi:hypothetical protein